VSELPEGWVACSLSDCVDVLDNLRVPVNSDERSQRQGKIPYYGATGQVGWIDDYLFDEELLLIGEDGAPFLDKSKPIAYIINGKSWVNNHAHVLRAKVSVTSNAYLKHFLNHFDFHEYVNGTTRLKLTQGAMNKIPVLLPPLAEQRRIVAKLETLLGKVGACQQRLAKIPAILKRFRQGVLAAACSGGLTVDWRENHECTEWETKTLGELVTDPKNGYSAKPVGRKTPYRVLTLTATTSGRFNPEHFKYFDEHIPADSPLWLRPGDILVQRGNTIEYVGVSAIYDGAPNQFVYPDLMIKFRAEDAIITKFLYMMLSWGRTRNYFRENATGTAGNMPKINQKVLAAAPIDVPSKPEQQEIVHRVEALFKLADQLEARYQKAKAQVDKLQQSILAKAFRGELTPTEAELARREGRDYEPASALLERIGPERAEHAQGRKEKAKANHKKSS